MRGRDVRAVLFCLASTLLVGLGAYVGLSNYIAAVALGAAWAVFVLSRPRMQRVLRRMRAAPDWSGYFRD